MRSTAAAIIGIALICATLIIGRAYNYKFKKQETISVIGGAEHNFTSDLIVWTADYGRVNYNLKEAYAALKSDETTVRAYLSKKGLSDSEMVFSSITIDKLYSYQYDERGRQTGRLFNGYKLMQKVKVQSQRIEEVEKTSREITELLQSGIELSSQQPLYYYTKLSDLKIELLKKATEDAYTRAKTIADNADSEIDDLKTASMGVFQITGQYNDEAYSYGGAFNTTSKNKTASITVRLVYTLED